MPVAHLTLHAYQSWMPSHPRGYVKRNKIEVVSRKLASRYRAATSKPAVVFTDEQLQLILSGTLDIAQNRGWRVHAVFGEVNHVHIIVSWKDQTRPMEVKRVMTNLLSLFLGKHAGLQGKRWFTRRASFRPVKTRKHLSYLVTTYAEKHRALRWREGDAEPPALDELLKRSQPDT